MSEEPRDRRSGEPLSEYVKQVANELPYDAVGLWQIVPGGRQGFGLEDDALTDFVRRCIVELLSRGAVPVVGGGETEHDWIIERRYGATPDEIVENVMREWLANGAKDEDPGGLWFARREDAWMPPDLDAAGIDIAIETVAPVFSNVSLSASVPMSGSVPYQEIMW